MIEREILVVEDEGIIAWDISDKLKSLGYISDVIVTSGEEAIDVVNKHRFDLVLMDINLSGSMDGIETANIIYKQHNIPIIFLTAYSDKVTLDRAKTTNPFGYILKPFSIRELDTAIDLALYKYEMNKRLASSEKKYRSLFETSHAGIMISTFPSGKILECNHRLKVMFNYSSDEDLTGIRFEDLFLEGDDIKHIRVALKEQKQLDNYEIKIRLKDDSVKWFECSSWLREKDTIHDTIFIDITERRRMEEKLRQTQKMEAIGQIAAGIAHEINTPLAVISTRLEILRAEIEKVECSKAVNQIDIIKKNIYRMSGIIERLLGFSRNIDSANTIINPVDVLNEVLVFVKTEANKKGISINTMALSSKYNLELNKNKLEQVFLNIIMNALDSMPQGGDLNIGIESNKKGPFVKISFTDNGEGMTEETRGKMFDPFFTTKEAGKGTGLGMYICYGIVKEMDGDIIIDSKVGHGTTVSILLPASKE